MAEKKRHSRGMDLGRVLLWSAVMVEAPRWAGAMLAADLKDVNGWLSAALNTGNTMAGVAMGLVNVVATAYMLDALRKERPTVVVHRRRRLTSSALAVATGHRPASKPETMETFERPSWRFYGLLVFIAGLLLLTPFVLAPFMVSRMTGDALETVLGTTTWRYVWSVTVVLAPVFVIGGVSFAQPGLVSISSASETEIVPKLSPKVTEKSDGKPATYGKWKTWRKVPDEERRKIAELNVDQVIAAYGVEERTAYNWLRDARDLTTKATK